MVSHADSSGSRDTVKLLDHLGVDEAHVVGQSMGGMVAQEFAIRHLERVASLAILWSTPDLSLAAPEPSVLSAAGTWDTTTRDGWVQAAVESVRVQTGTRWEFEEELVRANVEAQFDRALRPEGAERQLAAILRSPVRTGRLRHVRTPTLVLHGSDDPIFPVIHGVALAQAIPGARLVVIDGMGHAAPWGHWGIVLEPLLGHLGHAGDESRR